MKAWLYLLPLLAPVTSFASSAAYPKLDVVNCYLTNGVALQTVAGTDPLKVKANFFGVTKEFKAFIYRFDNEAPSTIYLEGVAQSYTLMLPIKATGDIQQVTGEIRRVTASGIYYPVVANATCAIGLAI